MLRRDRRRAQATPDAAAVVTEQTPIVEQAAAVVTLAATIAAESAEPQETPAPAEQDVISAPADAVDEAPAVDSPSVDETAADAAPSVDEAPADEVAADDEAPSAEEDASSSPASDAAEPAAARSPRGRKARPRRVRATASASRPASAAPVAARTERSSSRRRIGRMTTAALAVATLVCGVALPAVGMAQSGTASAASSVMADIRAEAQTYTASADVMPDVVVSGDFSATTPDEIEKIRVASAASAKSGIVPIAQPGQVIIPMAAGSYTMTDGFGASRPGRSHMGQDYAAPVGTPIYAAADGVVTMSQDSYGGYGVTVQVQHEFGGSSAVSTLYGHMDYGTRAVQSGDRVVAGQFLGRVGTTGYTIGSCLHFEVHINGTPINPVPWLDANVR